MTTNRVPRIHTRPARTPLLRRLGLALRRAIVRFHLRNAQAEIEALAWHMHHDEGDMWQRTATGLPTDALEERRAFDELQLAHLKRHMARLRGEQAKLIIKAQA